MKKYLFLIPILFIFFCPRNVFARINRIRTFNYDYSTTWVDISVPEGATYATFTGATNSTAFIRLNMTDNFEPNKTYSASFGFCIYVLDKDFQIEFGNLIGGWNVGGGYVSGTPVESTLVDYSHTTNASGRSQYMRCYTQRWQFTTPGTTTYPFFQIGLNTRYQTLNKFSWWNWTIEKVDSDMSDVTNSITNNTNQIIINNNNNTQQIINSQQETTDAINDLNDTLNDTSSPNTNNFINNSNNQLISTTPITDLLYMPYNLYNKFINGFGGSCSSFSLGQLFGTNLTIPCINLENLLGSNLWSIIDILFSGFMILNIGELLIHDFTSLMTLTDLFEETYTPRHANRGGN